MPSKSVSAPRAQAPVICECGHLASEHHNDLWCKVQDCECNKNSVEVYASQSKSLAARVASLEAALKAIRYEAGNSDKAQACENIIFEADAALGKGK